MSSSQYFPDCKKSGRAPEKSNFTQTCNLLSQYLKEKGSLRDLNLGITGNLEPIGKPETSRVTTTTTTTTPTPTPTTTMNLLTNMEKSGQTSSQDVKSMDLFPQYAGVVGSSTTTIEHATNKATSSEPATMETKMAQMTIFYGGQVFVFDDFPADKARELMLLAGSSPNASGFVSASSNDRINSASGWNTLPNSGSNPPAQEHHLQPQPEAISSDVPIARRASLHRFFEKRKERATARAPYQVHNPSTASPKPEEQLDLKL